MLQGKHQDRYSDETRGENERHGKRHQPGETRVEAEHDDLKPDQQEQDGVQDLVDDLPEPEKISLRLIAHGVMRAAVAEQEPGNNHRNRPTRVQAAGQCVRRCR